MITQNDIISMRDEVLFTLEAYSARANELSIAEHELPTNADPLAPYLKEVEEALRTMAMGLDEPQPEDQALEQPPVRRPPFPTESISRPDPLVSYGSDPERATAENPHGGYFVMRPDSESHAAYFGIHSMNRGVLRTHLFTLTRLLEQSIAEGQ